MNDGSEARMRRMSPIIREISPAETYPLRLPILRAGLPPESAVFPNDDAPETVHFGAFRGKELVGVASLYSAELPEKPQFKPAWQLRGMATLPEVRGGGYGRALVEACLAHCRARGAAIVWCNARSPAVKFYEMHGLQTLGDEFEIPTAGPHFRMWREL
jgi:GNAT superfamily N-acetyltransferase